MKTLLLDIDYTLADEETPRPFLKEFLEYVNGKYNLVLYTGGTSYRVTDFLRILRHNLGMEKDFTRKLQRTALHFDNCRMVEHFKKNGSSIEIKSFEKASESLNIPVEDMILLDDNPSYDHPNTKQIIQVEGFVSDDLEDDYLKRLITEL